MKESGKKQPRQLKPISTAKAVVIYVVCAALIVGMLVGNYFADTYRELITVYLSGSGTVTTAESEALCLEIEEEGMVLLQNKDGALPLKSGAGVGGENFLVRAGQRGLRLRRRGLRLGGHL